MEGKKVRFFRLNKNIDETLFNRFKTFVEKYENSDDELCIILNPSPFCAKPGIVPEGRDYQS
jgi:hypothetical protein